MPRAQNVEYSSEPARVIKGRVPRSLPRVLFFPATFGSLTRNHSCEAGILPLVKATAGLGGEPSRTGRSTCPRYFGLPGTEAPGCDPLGSKTPAEGERRATHCRRRQIGKCPGPDRDRREADHVSARNSGVWAKTRHRSDHLGGGSVRNSV